MELPDEIRKNGFRYTKVLKGDKSYIFCQYVTPDTVYFEVFKIRVRKETMFKGKKIPAGHRFPNDEAFGIWAWTYSNYDLAKRKFNELENVQD